MSPQERTDDTIKLEEIIERAKELMNKFTTSQQDGHIIGIFYDTGQLVEYVQEIARLRV